MNLEKAFDKRQKKHEKLEKKRNKKPSSLWMIILFPLVIYMKVKEKFIPYLVEKQIIRRWNEKRAKKCIDCLLIKFIPVLCSPDEPFVISDVGGITLSISNLFHLRGYYFGRKYDRKSRYLTANYVKAREYLLNEYEIDGYEKMELKSVEQWSQYEWLDDWKERAVSARKVRGVVFIPKKKE
ncbi:hypothetical protein M2140_000065 [Clostridiales Family XIII bacterium PM5-7]